jgi:type II secretory pathway component PulF
MPLYQYRAASQDGSITKGRVEALHEIDLEAQLKRIDLSLLSAKPL